MKYLAIACACLLSTAAMAGDAHVTKGNRLPAVAPPTENLPARMGEQPLNSPSVDQQALKDALKTWVENHPKDKAAALEAPANGNKLKTQLAECLHWTPDSPHKLTMWDFKALLNCNNRRI